MSTDNPMADLFPPEMTKYGLSFDFANAGESVKALIAQCWKLDTEIKAATESKDDSADKVVHPFDVKAQADKSAAKVAADLLSAFLTQCDTAIAKNRNVAWHLAQNDSAVTAYLTSEMQYYRFKDTPSKPVTTGTKLEEMREDRKVLTQTARKFLEAFPMLLAVVEKDENGKPKLPNLQGAGNRAADTPTGRYARYKQTIWTIDDKTFPVGTDPRDLVRAIWQGTDRVGKAPKDLFEPIDKARKDAKPGDKVTVTVNGHVVSYHEVSAE